MEARYAAELLLRQRAGEIRELRFHPKFYATVKALKGLDGGLSWEADGEYVDIETGDRIVYDIKPFGSPLGERSELLIPLFTLLLCEYAKVEIVRR